VNKKEPTPKESLSRDHPLRRKVKESTRDVYSHILNKHLHAKLGDLRLDRITPQTITDLLTPVEASLSRGRQLKIYIWNQAHGAAARLAHLQTQRQQYLVRDHKGLEVGSETSAPNTQSKTTDGYVHVSEVVAQDATNIVAAARLEALDGSDVSEMIN
jgi:Phage integrase, N-terminal SAM-like domain